MRTRSANDFGKSFVPSTGKGNMLGFDARCMPAVSYQGTSSRTAMTKCELLCTIVQMVRCEQGQQRAEGRLSSACQFIAAELYSL